MPGFQDGCTLSRAASVFALIHCVLALGPPAEAADAQTSAATIHAAGRGAPYLFLRDGRKVVTRYTGSFPYGQARPLALASADFDEDGMPDLASGFAAPDGTGIVTIHRGNVDALWPYGNAIRNGEPPAFLPEARVFTLPEAPDFLGAGDFDADGHWDLVAASLGGKTLYLLRGDGHGGFSAPEAIALPGALTAFTTGEINRIDGLTDIAVGVTGDNGSQVLVFESPRGALRGDPEVFPMPAAVSALAMMALDDAHLQGLAVGAGNELLSIHGRDRKLSYPKTLRDAVAAAEITRQTLPFAVRALAAGRFTSSVILDLAALGDDGKVHFLARPDAEYQAARAQLPVSIGGRNGLAAMRPGTADAKPLPKKPEGREMVLRDEVTMPSTLDAAARLVTAHTSITGGDDVIVVDGAGSQFHVVSRTSRGATSMHIAASLDAVSGAPAAVLPMRMTPSALRGLVVLQKGQPEPSVVLQTTGLTYTVTNTKDAGPNGSSPYNTAESGSLRWAISTIAAGGLSATINFAIPTTDPNYNPNTGTFTITPLPTTANNCATAPTSTNICAGLPALNAGTVLDGYTQPSGTASGITKPAASQNTLPTGDNAVIKIVISGASAGEGPIGIWLTGTDCTVRGLNVTGFHSVSTGGFTYGGGGIEVDNSDNFVEGNFSGIDYTGTTAAPNHQGVASFAGPNIIGGTTPQARNLLSGNSGAGFGVVSDFAPTPYFAQGNYIGTDHTGTVSVANGGGINNAGIGMMIGGTTAGAANLLSGNTFTPGIECSQGPGNSFTPDSNLIQGNLVGTDYTGTVALPNGDGVSIANGTGNQVGGTTPAARNVISGNGADGFQVNDGATLTSIQGNYIGVDVSGARMLSNALNGVDLQPIPNGADGTLIGGDIPGAGNVISGNGGNGVIFGAYTDLLPNGGTGSSVLGNVIGTDATGINPMGNGYDGILITQGGAFVSVGGIDASAGNAIAFNGAAGIEIDSNFAYPGQGFVDTVIGNSIFSNHGVGISLLAGVADEFSQNSIYSNGGPGINIGTSSSASDSCQTNATGPNNLQNAPVLTPATGGTTLVSATAIDPMGDTSQFSNCAAMANTGNMLNIAGVLYSLPSTSYTIEFFQNTVCDPSGYGQGKTFLNSITVTTDANCKATFGPTVDIATADLSVVLTDVNPIPNSNTVYTATVANAGAASASGVTFTDTLPATSETFVSVTTSAGTCGNSGNAITCHLGTMPSGSTATITITATITTTGSIANTANVNSSTPDPNTSNNTFTLNITAAPGYPSLDHISPTADIAGLGPLPLVIAGTNFYQGVTTVTANGTALPATVTNNQICGPSYAQSACQGLVVTIPESMTATPGTVTLVVANPDTNGFTQSASLSIYPSPGNAASYQITGIPATVVQGTNYNMTVTALDINANVATGYRGVATVPEGTFNVSFTPPFPYQFTAADNGSHTFTTSFTESPSGNGFTIQDAAIPTISGSVTAVSQAGTPTSFEANAAPGNVPIGFPFLSAFSVFVQDANDVNVVGATVTFTAPSSGASGKFSNGQNSIQVVTDSGGTAQATMTANQIAGTFNVTATLGSLSDTWTVTSIPGVPAHLAVISGDNQSSPIDTQFANGDVEVQVTDAKNNPIQNVTVTFVAPTSGPSVNFPLSTAPTEDTLYALLEGPLVPNGITGSYTVTASVGSLSTEIHFTNTAGPNPVAELLAGYSNQSATISTKFANPLLAQPVDSNGNCLAQVPVTFTAPSSGPSATLSGSTVKSDAVTCSATVTATANGVAGGPYTVTATSPGVAPITFQLTNIPTGLGALSPTGGTPQTATVGKAFATPLQVFAEDGNYNVLESQPITFTAPTSGASATLSASTVMCGLNGIATITATANNTPGTYPVIARYGSLTATFVLTNAAPVPGSVVATGGNTQSTVIGTGFGTALQATVLDQFANPLSGVTVTFTAPTSGARATFSSQTAVTNSNGAASVTATANGAIGSYLVTASAGSLNATFSLTNTAGPPASLTPSGTPQATTVGTEFSEPLQVTVKDSGGNLLSGVTVNFTAPTSGAGATLSAPSAVTNSSGVASVTATANSTVGGYSVSAKVGTLSAQFSLTNTALSPCDVNQDNVTNVQDVQKTINEALGKMSPANDLNGDKTVNVVDIQIVINAVLKLGCSAS